MNIRQKNLPVAVLQQIDDKCEQFETALQKGGPIAIESVLADVEDGAHRQLLLAELVALEIDYRKRNGESPSHDEYNDRFPEHTNVVKEAFAADKQSALPFAPPSINRVAELFPSLQVIELLGAGGMGAVYRARQPGLDRDVALKLLPEEFHHDARFSLRFTREARALAKLNHPNIVAVYEFGNIGDAYYFLMEYVDGTTLRSVVQSGELAPKQALAIVPQLCDALQYAHDQRVIHRDIKPENILLNRNGEVKIVDFGLSRIIGNGDQASPLTATNQVMGTPRYMAPEQYDGVHNVDHRADIYSLGVVFYELLTGELPLGRFAPPSKKVAIDVRLDEVVLRSLEKEPRFRYQAASDVKSDLQSIANSDDIPMAVTLDAELSRHSRGEISNTRSGERSGPAARMLLDRRNLMGQVQASLRPLFAWQTVQLLVGIALVALGAFCWTRNVNVPHRLVSGIILHVYGVAVIAAAVAVMVRIRRIDYFQPIEKVQERVLDVQSIYLRLSPLIGFPWWLMWIPVGIAAGFDQIMHPNSLIPSLIVGCIGIGVSLWAFYHVQRTGRENRQSWKDKFAGASLRSARKQLDEIAELGIR